MTTHRHLRTASGRPSLRALLAPVALVPVLLLVPAALPLCGMEVEACFTAAAPAVPPTALGDHCPMETAVQAEMPCCVEDTAPAEPVPVSPPAADSGSQLKIQLHAPAVAVAALTVPLPAPAPARAPAPDSTAPAVPLYTLLSSLLS